jgi:hypothetical protein
MFLGVLVVLARAAAGGGEGCPRGSVAGLEAALDDPMQRVAGCDWNWRQHNIQPLPKLPHH